MLSEEEKRDILKEISAAEEPQSACVEALKIVQGYRGFVSDEAVRDIAPLFEMTPDELDSVATFYTFIFRRPVGRHLIYLCDGVSCWIMGFDEIRRHIKDRLGIDFGGTTRDGMFTLLPVSCLGACDRAPAVIIDGELHGNLDKRKIDEIFLRYAQS